MSENNELIQIPTPEADPPRVAKLCGADVELGNFIEGVERVAGSGSEASRALLREIDGIRGDQRHSTQRVSSVYGGWYFPSAWSNDASWDRDEDGGDGHNSDRSSWYNPQDWGRKYLPQNGGCVYIDLNHLEICLPEVRSAFDHLACWHAMLRIAREAQERANARQEEGRKIHVLVNNSDGLSNSYGSHMNFLITSRAMENLFARKCQYLLYLASFQISSILYTGQGKVGSENDAPAVDFQLSQRADFFERLTGFETTFARPVVNSRDEAHCGDLGRRWGSPNLDEGMARLHVIFFDSTLSHASHLLKIGTMQIVLAMIEAERVSLDLLLEDPLDALRSWSHDPTLSARARLLSGRSVTAVELQKQFLEEARAFEAQGGCEDIVPRAGEILDLWEDTLGKLEERDLGALTRRLDWVLKKSILERVLQQRPDLDWSAPEIKHLDLMFSSLDRGDGLYWGYENFMERIVSDAEIDRFVTEPPTDTRAWTRAMLLRAAGPEHIEEVDWDLIRFRMTSQFPRTIRTLEIPSPLGFGKAEVEPIFRARQGLEEILDSLNEHTGGGASQERRESHGTAGASEIRPAASGSWTAQWPRGGRT